MENTQGFTNVVVFQLVLNPPVPSRVQLRLLAGSVASVFRCGGGNHLVVLMTGHCIDPRGGLKRAARSRSQYASAAGARVDQNQMRLVQILVG
jgi:hypothetical protein